MYDPAVYRIRVQGKLKESWMEYFGVQSTSVQADEDGASSTIMITGPVDQAALVGMINHLNGLGHPLLSVEWVAEPLEG